MSCLVRCITITFWTLEAPFSRALSTSDFRGTILSLRKPPSAVTTTLASASSKRSRNASALNPPKTTLWGAPILVQANIAIAASGTIGI